MVDNLIARFVESGSQMLLRKCQTNSISNSLPKWTYTEEENIVASHIQG